jgi:hypothetical protein
MCCEPKVGYRRIPRTGDIAERRKAELIYCTKNEVESDECTSNGEGVVKEEICERGHREEIPRWGEGIDTGGRERRFGRKEERKTRLKSPRPQRDTCLYAAKHFYTEELAILDDF